MAALKEKTAASLLGSASVTMNSAASTTLFTVPVGKIARIAHVVVRDNTASLAGLTNCSFTQWLQNVDLSQVTTANTSYVFLTPIGIAGPTLLGLKAGVNMAAGGGPTTIFTTPAGTVTRISHILVRDPSATLASGTSFQYGTGFRNNVGVSLTTLTTANTDYIVLGNHAIAGDDVKCTEIAASTNFVQTNTTGSAGAATATIEVYGFQEPPNVFAELAASTAFQMTITTAATAAGTATVDVFGYLT